MVLNELREWLRLSYERLLGQKLELAPSAASIVWSADNNDSACVHLFDAEIGVWTRIAVIEDVEIAATCILNEVQETLRCLATVRPQINIPANEQDPHGLWSVCMLFLVHRTCEHVWRETIQALRAESGFSEEFGLQVVFYDQSASLSGALDRTGGLPHLLLATRRLLSLDSNKAPSWVSADERVRDMLTTFPSNFDEGAAKKLSEELVAHVFLESGAERNARFPIEPQIVTSLTIKGFRNIDQLTIPFVKKESQVHTQIVFGPNGTGKSSIFEALSLSVSGASKGLEDYLNDPDNRLPNAQQYVANVLSAFGGSIERQPVPPLVELNGDSKLSSLATDRDDAKRRRISTDGTLLSQEEARSFVVEDSKTRGARVLAGYSSLAQAAQAYAATEYGTANRLRQEWLRQFGLSLNIKKSSTRWEKICRHFIDSEAPRITSQVDSWLSSVCVAVPGKAPLATELTQLLNASDGEAARVQLTVQLSRLGEIGGDEQCTEILTTWMAKRDRVVQDISALTMELRPHVELLVSQRAEIEKDLRTWHEWRLKRKNAAGQSIKVSSASNNVGRLHSLEKRLGELGLLGQRHTVHLEHLQRVQGEFLRKWAEHNPNNCPTCNSAHEGDGGIEAVVEKLTRSVASTITRERALYTEIQSQIKEIEKERELNGECPLSEGRRSQIALILGYSPRSFESIDIDLERNEAVNELMYKVDGVIALPALASTTNSNVIATQIWRKISNENSRGEALWSLPDRWDSVKGLLDEKCISIVKQHLPQTLEAVWLEIGMALTSARWNLVCEPQMQADTQRGAEKLRLLATSGSRSVAAKYLYNQAEQHTLGIAWYFTRYLAVGRFHHALVAMDDPAQEMDQTTFRTFTRFLQAFTRLHARRNKPLSLVVLLHQEERALDLARATEQQLTTIKWGRRIKADGPDSSVESLVLLSSEFKAKLPSGLVSTTQMATMPNALT